MCASVCCGSAAGTLTFVHCVLECRRLYNALKAGVLQSSGKENKEGLHSNEQKCAQMKVSITSPSLALKRRCVSPGNDAGVFGRAFNKSTRGCEDGPALPSMTRLRKWSKPKRVDSTFCGASGSKLEEEEACGSSCSKLEEEEASGASTTQATCRSIESLGEEDDNDHGLVLGMSEIQEVASTHVSCVGAATPPLSPVQNGFTPTTPTHTSDVVPPGGSPTEVLLAGLYTTSSAKCEQLGNTFLHRLKGSKKREECEDLSMEAAPRTHGEVPDVCEEETRERGPVCSAQGDEECEPPAKKLKRETTSK